MKLFGVDIAKELAKGMAKGLLQATLIRVIPGTRSSSAPTAGTNSTKQSSPCKGFIQDYSASQFDGTSIMKGDRKVILLGGTLPSNVVPTPGDEVTIEGKKYDVVTVKRDPAAATYELQARGS